MLRDLGPKHLSAHLAAGMKTLPRLCLGGYLRWAPITASQPSVPALHNEPQHIRAGLSHRKGICNSDFNRWRGAQRLHKKVIQGGEVKMI